MKTSEFIKHVERLGYHTNIRTFGERMIIMAENGVLLSVSNTAVGIIDSDYVSMHDSINEDDKATLLTYALRYSLTPLEHREDEADKFTYSPPESLMASGDYLNLKSDGMLLFDTKYETDRYQSKFTDEEVETLSIEQRKIFAMCDKSIVEDN